jgi:hypothetical protein
VVIAQAIPKARPIGNKTPPIASNNPNNQLTGRAQTSAMPSIIKPNGKNIPIGTILAHTNGADFDKNSGKFGGMPDVPLSDSALNCIIIPILLAAVQPISADAAPSKPIQSARARKICIIPKTDAIIKTILTTAINPASAILACDGADIPVIIPVNVLSKKTTASIIRLTLAIILRRLLLGDRFIFISSILQFSRTTEAAEQWH